MSDQEKTAPPVTSPDLPPPETEADAQSENPPPSSQRASETLSPTSIAIKEPTVSPKTERVTGLWSRQETQPADKQIVPTTNFGLWMGSVGESGNTGTHQSKSSTSTNAGVSGPEPPGQDPSVSIYANEGANHDQELDARAD